MLRRKLRSDYQVFAAARTKHDIHALPSERTQHVCLELLEVVGAEDMRQLTESPWIQRRQAHLQVFDQVTCFIPVKAALGDGEDDDRDPMRHCLVQLQQAPRAREYSLCHQQDDAIRDVHAVIKEHPQVRQVVGIQEYWAVQNLAQQIMQVARIAASLDLVVRAATHGIATSDSADLVPIGFKVRGRIATQQGIKADDSSAG